MGNVLNEIALLASIFTALFTFVSFGIKAFTGRHAEEVFHEIIHRPTRPQQSSQSGTAPIHKSPSLAVPRPPLSARWSWRGLIPHPWLFGAFLLGQLLFIVPILAIGPSNYSLAGSLELIGILVLIVSWISCIVIATRETRWVWFIAILLGIVIGGYPVLFFSLFARPKQQVPQPSQVLNAQPGSPSRVQTSGAADLHCSRCGTIVTHPKRYCPHCGTSLKTS